MLQSLYAIHSPTGDEWAMIGGEAMNLYPQIVRPGRTAAEIEADRKSLLEYCALDTLAMVKVWEKLREMAK